MRNGMFVPVTRVQSSPDVKSDGKARVDTGKPTLTQQGIDVDEFIRKKPRAHRKTQERNTLKHEYTADELAELKSIYDESCEAGLQIGEMRALRKAYRRNRRNRRNAISSSRTAKTASAKASRSTARKQPKR